MQTILTILHIILIILDLGLQCNIQHILFRAKPTCSVSVITMFLRVRLFCACFGSEIENLVFVFFSLLCGLENCICCK